MGWGWGRSRRWQRRKIGGRGLVGRQQRGHTQEGAKMATTPTTPLVLEAAAAPSDLELAIKSAFAKNDAVANTADTPRPRSPYST